MIRRAALIAVLLSACLARAQEPKQLWLYYPINMLVEKNVDRAQEIWSRAAKAGYTHVLITDSKFSRLADMDARYFKNVERVKGIAKGLKLTLVPAMFSVGYSNDLLSRDPNLAEGLPVRDALFVVTDNVATLQPDPAPALKVKWNSMDDEVKLAGGVATVADNKGNARLIQKLTLKPFRHYHISVQVKTDKYTGKPEVKVLASNPKGEQPTPESLRIPTTLNWTELKAKQTQDWATHHVTFNTLGHADVNVYLGVWSKATGTLQWRDWKIEEVGLLNVLRRTGTPLVVKDEATGKALEEGKDFEPIKDPKTGMVPYAGEYEVFHAPPPIKTKGVADGTRLRVSWYHPHMIYDHQVCACPSDPKMPEILTDQATRMKKLWADVAGGWMMNHDEIRSLGTDAACLATGKTPGQILAGNARFCVALLADTKKPIYVWNDMFDPHHNAVPGPYYLVNGPFTNAWEGLDKSVVIMNWNNGKRDKSLPFFADRGHQQVIAGYYDAKPEKINDWLDSAAKVKGVTGVMYTTWKQDYAQIERFAELVKGHK